MSQKVHFHMRVGNRLTQIVCVLVIYYYHLKQSHLAILPSTSLRHPCGVTEAARTGTRRFVMRRVTPLRA
jgi:hypothetical protein